MAYSRKTPSAGTQIEDFKSLDQLLNVWHFIKLNKLQNYIQIKGIKTINTYSAKHLSIAASSTVTQAWGTAVARGLNRGASLAPLHGISRTVDPSFISIPFITFFFFTYMKHTAKYILIAKSFIDAAGTLQWTQESPPSLGGWDVCTNPQGFSTSKTQALPFPTALGSAPAQIIPILNRQCTQVHLTNTGQPRW